MDGAKSLNCSNGPLTELAAANTTSRQTLLTIDFKSRYRVADFSRNYINSISPGIWRFLPLLEHLYLNENRIKTVPRGIFIRLRNLELLDLSRNPLKSLAEDFGALPELRALLLEHTALGDMAWQTSLGNYLSTGTNRGERRVLHLTGSSFLCGCHILWLANGKLKAQVITEVNKSVSGDAFGSVTTSASPTSPYDLRRTSGLEEAATEVTEVTGVTGVTGGGNGGSTAYILCSMGDLRGIPYFCLFRPQDKYCRDPLSVARETCALKSS